MEKRSSNKVKPAIAGLELDNSLQTRTRPRKRKQRDSSSSTDLEDVLPENSLEFEKNLHASAMKNNLDESSVRKILKKVVTNDHVLALVKLREEEECSKTATEKNHTPKLTRSKAKELSKGSPKSAPWDPQNLELTPIKQLPVKTRPEVTALIAQELPEDEDDEEYEPNQDEAMSDDDQTLESCSDLDSQPRTPATPRAIAQSPRIVNDGPFKVPQEIRTPVRRKIDMEEEEATIALRTRSKLCLSETPIEHIESSFVPPDELPMPVVDDLWNDFLNDCLNPVSVNKNEDDDEADPEYNVAADADNDEDEESLERSIIKISKKELNDLVTELFNIMPEDTASPNRVDTSRSIAIDKPKTSMPVPLKLHDTLWEGKKELISDEEHIERTEGKKFSVGKTEPEEIDDAEPLEESIEVGETLVSFCKTESDETQEQGHESDDNDGTVAVEYYYEGGPPPSVRNHQRRGMLNSYTIELDQQMRVLPEQRNIIEQQLRQHIQLATSNFLQLCVHPVHWKYAPAHKEYLDTFMKLAKKNSNSVVNVCNLEPSWELITSWETAVTASTPENCAMVEFIHEQIERNRRRAAQNSLYVGEFHDRFKQVIANSCVFLYPHLLPPIPYRYEVSRRFNYLPSEDSLIVIHLDQFWQYVDDNPELFKRPPRENPQYRWGLGITAQLVCQHALTWLTPKMLLSHIRFVRRSGDKNNPINKFFKNREVTPVEHTLLPFKPGLPLYEQSEKDMPRMWVRYLCKTSKQFTRLLYSRNFCKQPDGIPMEISNKIQKTTRDPLPVEFTKSIYNPKILFPEKQNKLHNVDIIIKNSHSDQEEINNELTANSIEPTKSGQNGTKSQNDLFDEDEDEYIKADKNSASHMFTVVHNSSGSFLIPFFLKSPNTSSDVGKVEDNNNCELSDHCKCCIMIREICKNGQRTILDYFKGNSKRKACPCKEVRKYPRITNKLKLLVNFYKTQSDQLQQVFKEKIDDFNNRTKSDKEHSKLSNTGSNMEDLAQAMSYYTRLSIFTGVARVNYLKIKIYNIFKKFDLNEGDPTKLCYKLDQAFGTDLYDLYTEFIGFLNAQQADHMDRFKEYFVHNCATDFIKKVEEEVACEKDKLDIILNLKEVLNDHIESSCDLCEHLLFAVQRYPKLAKYVFSLFPHRWKEKPNVSVPLRLTALDKLKATKQQEQLTSSKQPDEMDIDQVSISDSNSKTCNENADRVSIHADDELSSGEDLQLEILSNCEEPVHESIADEYNIKIEDDCIKTEPADWSREEDKLILTVLKETLTPEERKDKTILDIIEDEGVLDIISSGLSNKCTSKIKDRVAYILELLVLSDLQSH